MKSKLPRPCSALHMPTLISKNTLVVRVHRQHDGGNNESPPIYVEHAWRRRVPDQTHARGSDLNVARPGRIHDPWGSCHRARSLWQTTFGQSTGCHSTALG